MRITDDRYHRERLRMELALRFLRHEARTQTIRNWTGLSDDRIRKLYRSYLNDARRELPRHRGKSPHQIAYFTRSTRLQEETLALATPLWLLGVLTIASTPETPGSLAALAAAPVVRGVRVLPHGAPRAQTARGVPRQCAVARELLRIGWCTLRGLW
jgi:hypothetical protein